MVDEYDTPVIEGELKGYYEEISNFMDAFLGEGLKGNNVIFKGIVTGITKLQGTVIFSGVNSVRNCTIFDSAYKDKFGFTEKEVQELLKSYGMKEKEENVRKHYNGYNFRGEVIYNPYSVLSYMDQKELGNFWLNSSKNDLARKKVQDLLEMKGDETLRKEVEGLLQGAKVRVKIREELNISEKMKSVDILNLLLYSGYLKYENYFKNGSVGYADVSIPNLEIKAVYDLSIEKWMEREYTKEEIGELNKFLDVVC